jgi:hypothetical protein
LAPSGGHCHFCYRQFAWASHTPCWKKVRVERARDKRRKRAVSSVTCAQAVALLADYISGEIKGGGPFGLGITSANMRGLRGVHANLQENH